MTLRKLIYRLYLQSPGWALTRLFRKDCKCAECRSRVRLELHHEGYPFFGVWYPLFFVTPVVLLLGLYEIGAWLALALLIVPDFISPLKTLCSFHHGAKRK